MTQIITSENIESVLSAGENDTVELIESMGFKLEHVHTLKNIKRSFGSVYWEKHTVGMNKKADEKIFVFKKI